MINGFSWSANIMASPFKCSLNFLHHKNTALHEKSSIFHLGKKIVANIYMECHIIFIQSIASKYPIYLTPNSSVVNAPFLKTYTPPGAFITVYTIDGLKQLE